MRPVVLLLWLLLFNSQSCGSSKEDGARSSGDTTEPRQGATVLPTSVDVSRADLIFRYWDVAKAGFETQTSWSDIPASSPQLVIVRDPKARHPGRFLIVDKATCTPHQACPIVVMNGRQLERAMAKQRGVAAPSDKRRLPMTQTPTLNFYTASWCSACTKARSYLKENRIAHREYDVEQDPTAKKRLMQLGQRKGMGAEKLRSVPIFTYGNEIMVGFAPQKLRQLMR